ncbi:hypothetical protein FOZ61_008327 [Perkinsus olseni]|uniref:RNase H type-1 domain-containing protein n=1 Tax=Perkinsus olseni TaxID=32597 RepID=A0A7J6L588_PEROL|nr:hypothetical protein FOZ61_008327 [Perkinsus olseni]
MVNSVPTWLLFASALVISKAQDAGRFAHDSGGRGDVPAAGHRNLGPYPLRKVENFIYTIDFENSGITSDDWHDSVENFLRSVGVLDLEEPFDHERDQPPPLATLHYTSGDDFFVNLGEEELLCMRAQRLILIPVVKDVKTGAAMVVYREGGEVYSNFWKLSPYASITDCELLVLEAVRWIVSTAGDEAWEIFTDSLAVLKMLSSRASTARVSLRWVPGHSSISANERADELAAKGASIREVSAETEISVRTLRRYQGEAGRLSLRK